MINLEKILSKYNIGHNLSPGVSCRCIGGAKDHLRLELEKAITEYHETSAHSTSDGFCCACPFDEENIAAKIKEGLKQPSIYS